MKTQPLFAAQAGQPGCRFALLRRRCRRLGSLCFLIAGLLTVLAGVSAFATETPIVGNKGTAWPSSWTEIPKLRDGNDCDPNGGNDRLDLITDSTGKGTVYWAKDDGYVYFRTRANIATVNLSTFRDALWIYINKVGSGSTVADYAFTWDSSGGGGNSADHGLEMMTYSGGTVWQSIVLNDLDGNSGQKLANDINGNIPVRGYDGFVRVLDTQDNGTSVIDWAVSWTYLETYTQLRRTDTWYVAVGSKPQTTDHQVLGSYAASDLAGLASFTDVTITEGGSGWSGPLSPQGQTSRTWDGGSGTASTWNLTANWDPDALPAENDNLIFLDSAARKSNNNNLLTTVGSVTFSSGTVGGYNLAGNALTINGGIANDLSSGTTTWAINATLGAAQSLTTASGGTLDFDGAIANGGFLLTVDGAGTTLLDGIVSGTGGLTKSGSGTLTLAGANSYIGATTVSAGKLLVNGATALGSAVTVSSGGTLGGTGTAAGTVGVSGTIAPGTSVGTLITGAETWNGAASYTWEINEARGTAGASSGWDWLSISAGATGSNGLTVAASSGSPFTIKLVTLSGTSAGDAANFNPAHHYAWAIVTVTDAITNFVADKFVLNTTEFSSTPTWVGAGTFSVATSGKSLYVVYTPNCFPPDTGKNRLVNPVMHVWFTNMSGLSDIKANRAENCAVVCRAYDIKGGQILPELVVVAAVKVNLPPGTTGVHLLATRVEGLTAVLNVQAANVCGTAGKTDPTIFDLVVPQGGMVEKRVEGIPKVERYLQVFNGRPGLRSLTVFGNGQTMAVGSLLDGGSLERDLGALLADGDSNTLVFTGTGAEGAGAVIMLAEAQDSALEAAPTLAVTPIAGGVELSWLGQVAQWQLQGCPAIGAAWENVTAAPAAQNGRNRVVEKLGANSRFFRLQAVSAPASATSISGAVRPAGLSGTASQPELKNTYGDITW